MTDPAARRLVGGRLSSIRGRDPQLTAAAIALAGVGVVAVVDPNTTHVPLCPLHAMTGLWCPFCGGLRAVFELTRGQLATAAHDNLLVVVALPVVVLLWLDALRRGPAPSRRWPVAARLAVLSALVAFTVLRNLAPFPLLRP